MLLCPGHRRRAEPVKQFWPRQMWTIFEAQQASWQLVSLNFQKLNLQLLFDGDCWCLRSHFLFFNDLVCSRSGSLAPFADSKVQSARSIVFSVGCWHGLLTSGVAHSRFRLARRLSVSHYIHVSNLNLRAPAWRSIASTAWKLCRTTGTKKRILFAYAQRIYFIWIHLMSISNPIHPVIRWNLAFLTAGLWNPSFHIPTECFPHAAKVVRLPFQSWGGENEGSRDSR